MNVFQLTSYTQVIYLVLSLSYFIRNRPVEEFKNQTFAKNNLCWILCFHIHTDCPILARNHHFHSASSDTLSPITMVDNCHVASIVASKQAAFANFEKNVKKSTAKNSYILGCLQTSNIKSKSNIFSI